MDYALLVATIIVFVLIIISSLYFIVYFQHPEDKNMAYFPKLVVLLSLTLAFSNVIVLTGDILNRNDFGGIPFALIIQILLYSTLFTVLVLVPFSIFYYEYIEDDQITNPVRHAILYTIIVVFLFAVVSVAMYIYIGYIQIELDFITADLVSESSPEDTTVAVNSTFQTTVWKLRTGYGVYSIAVLDMFGFIMFAIFGGIGLASFPFSLIRTYQTRPKPITVDQYAEFKLKLNRRSQLLLEEGKKLEGKDVRVKYRKKYNKFRRKVYELESDYKKLEEAYRDRGGNPLKYLGSLLFGIIGSIISLLWFIHVFVYVLPSEPLSPFLNAVFLWCDEHMELLGTTLYTIFSVYLFLCVINGFIEFGFRLLLMPIHPIKYGETLMSSLLFNSALFLITSVAVTQFCSIAFKSYVSLTAVDSLFNTQVANLEYFNIIFPKLTLVFEGLAVLSFLYFLFKSAKREEKVDQLNF